MTTFKSEADYLKNHLNNLNHSLKHFTMTRTRLESSETPDLEGKLDTMLRYYDLVLNQIRGEIVETTERMKVLK